MQHIPDTIAATEGAPISETIIQLFRRAQAIVLETNFLFPEEHEQEPVGHVRNPDGTKLIDLSNNPWHRLRRRLKAQGFDLVIEAQPGEPAFFLNNFPAGDPNYQELFLRDHVAEVTGGQYQAGPEMEAMDRTPLEFAIGDRASVRYQDRWYDGQVVAVPVRTEGIVHHRIDVQLDAPDVQSIQVATPDFSGIVGVVPRQASKGYMVTHIRKPV